MGAAGLALLAGFDPPTVICGVEAALAVVIPGSDLRPSEYPSAKNNAQIATRVKNSTRSLPVPSVISVSWDEVIVEPHELRALLGGLGRDGVAARLTQDPLQSREEIDWNREDHSRVFFHA